AALGGEDVMGGVAEQLALLAGVLSFDFDEEGLIGIGGLRRSRGEVAGGVLATEGVDGQGAVMGGVDDGVTAALGVAAPEPAFVVIGARGGGGAVILPNAD